MIGYALGALAFDVAGRALIDWLGYADAFEQFQNDFRERGFWVVLTIGVTPAPFQVATVGSGLAGYPIPLFLAAAALARGIRYYGLAALVVWFGDDVMTLMNRYAHRGPQVFWMVSAMLVAIAVWLFLAGGLRIH